MSDSTILNSLLETIPNDTDTDTINESTSLTNESPNLTLHCQLSSHRSEQEPAPIVQPTGLDRLAQFGFSSSEIDDLRAGFNSIQEEEEFFNDARLFQFSSIESCIGMLLLVWE